ncbi:hypothetical protein ASPZODRAFT_127833 [Penicilliopsis zonata CBS 506.65]|uniref:Small ribosomal subunit protein mS38 n=1 Tax=Penicilliopsis zonata CBS 506.65 TaxID=1073090 RepID=A0A1L9SX87_9EURO|nr:hypothetical protein ASPZODRAFT_127833 [Penicilliopsis zonata CBS 506.65]OJJ51711.1 hypothetical protein ASPZODRAFT_127833 [Penicilliopsis zonata CBS 506.65]
MLSSSIRRAVPLAGSAWAPSQSISIASSSSAVLGATRRVHQRRYSSSSSKPPVPPSDGPRRIDPQAATKSVGPAGDKREGKAARRRGKDGNGRHGSSKSNQNAAFANLPSVPSTQHVQPHDVHIASFFSIHRPMSISSTVPPTSSAEAFNAIFSARKPARAETDEVIFTLSSAVNTMENAATVHHPMGEQEELGPHTVNRVDAETGAVEGMMNMEEMKMSIEEYARRLRPFHPPPAPVPMDEAASAKRLLDAEEDVSRHTSSYSTVLTIRESTHSDGRKTYEAHTTPFVHNQLEDPATEAILDLDLDQTPPSGRTYIERVRNNLTMHAMSTKRRRRLKMKKHKFKKLLRRTRTLRRKLDKA